MWSVHRGNSKRVVLVRIQTISTRKFSHFARSAQDLDHPNPFLFICLLLRIGALNSTIVKPRSTDTSLLRTVCFVPGETKPRHQFSLLKFNPLNTDPPFVRTLFMVPSILVLTGFDCRNGEKFSFRILTIRWTGYNVRRKVHTGATQCNRSKGFRPFQGNQDPKSGKSGAWGSEIWNPESTEKWSGIQ